MWRQGTSICPFVCLSVCKHVCRRNGICFRYLHNLTLKGTFWPSFKKLPPSGLGGDAITRKCLQTDERTDGCWDLPQESSSRLCPEELMITKQYATVSYIPSTYNYQGSSVRMVAICGLIGTHRAPCGSYMRRELFAARSTLQPSLHRLPRWTKMMLK